MKNVQEHQLKKCIYLELDELEDIVYELFDTVGVEYTEYDGLRLFGEEDLIEGDELCSKLKEYFSVNIISVHSDRNDPTGVWIEYAE